MHLKYCSIEYNIRILAEVQYLECFRNSTMHWLLLLDRLPGSFELKRRGRGYRFCSIFKKSLFHFAFRQYARSFAGKMSTRSDDNIGVLADMADGIVVDIRSGVLDAISALVVGVILLGIVDRSLVEIFGYFQVKHAEAGGCIFSSRSWGSEAPSIFAPVGSLPGPWRLRFYLALFKIVILVLLLALDMGRNGSTAERSVGSKKLSSFGFGLPGQLDKFFKSEYAERCVQRVEEGWILRFALPWESTLTCSSTSLRKEGKLIRGRTVNWTDRNKNQVTCLHENGTKADFENRRGVAWECGYILPNSLLGAGQVDQEGNNLTSRVSEIFVDRPQAEKIISAYAGIGGVSSSGSAIAVALVGSGVTEWREVQKVQVTEIEVYSVVAGAILLVALVTFLVTGWILGNWAVNRESGIRPVTSLHDALEVLHAKVQTARIEIPMRMQAALLAARRGAEVNV